MPNTKNSNSTYTIINAIALKHAQTVDSLFAGDVHVIFNKPKSSDKERLMEMVSHLIKLDRILISDRNYVYNIHEFGSSLEKKKAYAEKFCELCNVIGIATTKKLLPYKVQSSNTISSEKILRLYK